MGCRVPIFPVKWGPPREIGDPPNRARRTIKSAIRDRYASEVGSRVHTTGSINKQVICCESVRIHHGGRYTIPAREDAAAVTKTETDAAIRSFASPRVREEWFFAKAWRSEASRYDDPIHRYLNS